MLSDNYSLLYVVFFSVWLITSTFVEILSLKHLSKLLKFKNQDLKTHFLVSVLSSFIALSVAFIMDQLEFNATNDVVMILDMTSQIISFVIYFLLLKKFYKEGLKKTILIGFLVIAILTLWLAFLFVLFLVLGAMYIFLNPGCN
jgi:hypothetical protein